ncbi:MAG: prepilin-type N-terminal cleavage/methylation domain-containing protein [Chthoniobacterales bacterium]
MTSRSRRCEGAFTLIELMVVIAIIVILMGLLFPAFRGVQDQAKKTQAKNDLTQIVTAVNAYYTEYGKYPTAATSDIIFGAGGSANNLLFNPLRGLDVTLNPRQIVFLNAPDAKNQTTPVSGIQTSTGVYFDPWGSVYSTKIDADYTSQIETNPYATNAGSSPLRQGVIAWALGKDKAGGSGSSDKNAGTADDDIISWQ